MNRRQFLGSSFALGGGLVASRILAAPSASATESRPRFLLVFLRGGYDAANLLIPNGNSFYYEARPNIAIPRAGTTPDSAVPLNADWALHPAVKDSLLPFYTAGELAFVPFAGIDDLTRSHFETQDSVELGLPLGAGRSFQSGFMNRLSNVLGTLSPIAFCDQLPMAFRGPVSVPNMALRTLSRPGVDARQGRLITQMYAGDPLEKTVRNGFDFRNDIMRELAEEMEAASRGAVPSNGFEAEARRIAHLMRTRYELGFVDIGGWDTHVSQGGASGYLASRLGELGKGLSIFASEMGEVWKKTIIVVVSEFGRTFRENGNRGTDHGHGSVYWVLGGSVRGGAITGVQQKITPDTLFQNRDYPVLNDYRHVLGSVFSRQFGLSPAQISEVFPGIQLRDLALL